MKWKRWLTAWSTACVFAAVATIVAAESSPGVFAAAPIGSPWSGFALHGDASTVEAVAGCAGISIPIVHQAALLTTPVLQRPHSWMLRRTGDGAAQFANAPNQTADLSIVGFWRFTFTAAGNATIPDGTTLDAGFVQWHSDGTEVMNSSRPPATQSFCLGVWSRTGRATYTLNHFALSWDLNNNFVGPANIREEVTVAQGGQSYAGDFTINQFDQSGNVLAHVTGNVMGTRITVDTTPAEIR